MAHGTRSKFGAPVFEPEVFRKQMYCIEESIHDIVGTFRRPPQWFGARRIAPLLSPLVKLLDDGEVLISEPESAKLNHRMTAYITSTGT